VGEKSAKHQVFMHLSQAYSRIRLFAKNLGVLQNSVTFVELHLYLCEAGADSNTMASPILYLTPLDFNFWGHTNDLVYVVEINTKGQLQKRVTDAANQIRKNPEMLNSVYENWYRRARRTQMCINANGKHTEHLFI
jgi:hypothetical protein